MIATLPNTINPIDGKVIVGGSTTINNIVNKTNIFDLNDTFGSQFDQSGPGTGYHSNIPNTGHHSNIPNTGHHTPDREKSPNLLLRKQSNISSNTSINSRLSRLQRDNNNSYYFGPTNLLSIRIIAYILPLEITEIIPSAISIVDSINDITRNENELLKTIREEFYISNKINFLQPILFQNSNENNNNNSNNITNHNSNTNSNTNSNNILSLVKPQSASTTQLLQTSGHETIQSVPSSPVNNKLMKSRSIPRVTSPLGMGMASVAMGLVSARKIFVEQTILPERQLEVRNISEYILQNCFNNILNDFNNKLLINKTINLTNNHSSLIINKEYESYLNIYNKDFHIIGNIKPNIYFQDITDISNHITIESKIINELKYYNYNIIYDCINNYYKINYDNFKNFIIQLGLNNYAFTKWLVS